MKRWGRFALALTLLVSLLSVTSSPVSQAAYTFTSHTFTPCSATGISGPTQAACRSAYSTTWDETDANFTVSAGIQLWTVAGTGKYRFEIAGASSPIQGRGRIIQFETTLTEGQQLKILVGQKSSCYLTEGCGGAGGSFVVDTSANIIGIAGGGGGYGTDATGSQTSSGGAGYGAGNVNAGAPASGGAGGGKGSNGEGNSGAGYSGNGATNSSNAAGPIAFTSGGTASAGYDSTASGKLGSTIGNGGFGGGGGAWYNASGGYYTRSGGGGGYSGGGAGGYNGGYANNGGGGGGSFITASATTSNWSYGFNPINTDGYVTITSLGPSITTFAPRNSITGSSTVVYDLVFSETVTGLTTGDFTIGGSGGSSCQIGISGSNTTYVVTLTSCSEGSVTTTIAANAVANTTPQYAPSANTAAATVTVDFTAPTISSVSAPSNKTYLPSETPTFTVAFNESITVTGTPRLTLTVGSLTKYANYVSMSDSKTALFRYTVGTSAGEFDTDGLAVNAFLDTNGGTIEDLALNDLVVYTFSAPTLTSVLVAQKASAPSITSITPGSSQLSVNFTAGSSNGAAITNYKYSLNGGAFTAFSPIDTVTPLVITGLTNGTGYTVRILAVNLAGDGESSTAVTETPSAISVTGDATIVLTYGTAGSTGSYSASGGTNTFTWSLGSSISGVTISGTVVSVANTLAAGTYSQTVRATDGASAVGSKALTITVNKAASSISLALQNGTSQTPLGEAPVISISTDRAGSVAFSAGGFSISACASISISSTTGTCTLPAPNSTGSITLTAIFTPTSGNYETSTATITFSVVNGISTISIVLAGGVTQVNKNQAIVITATIDQAGKVTFLANGKRIPGCISLNASVGTKNCTWKPAIQGQLTLSASLIPTNSNYRSATISRSVTVVRRSGTR